MQNGGQLHRLIDIYRGSAYLPGETAQGQRQRRCCAHSPSSGGEPQGSAQGAGMLSKKRLGGNLDTAGYFEKGGNELAHSSFISDTAAVAVSLSQGSLWTK